MSQKGYYRYPHIVGDTVVFVCEGDLWSASTHGGQATRLTTTQAGCTTPRISPDGKQVAFVGREDGSPEVYLLSSFGSAPKRLTYLGSDRLAISGWTKDGKILFASDCKTPFSGTMHGYSLDPVTAEIEELNFGLLVTISVGDNGAVVLGKNEDEPAWWKRYRGGQRGEIWVDRDGDGSFKKILDKLNGNPVLPMFVGNRIYFVSDHDGIGNLYSCRANGSDLRQHSEQREYYARFASTDGERLVYTAGGDIFVFDPKTGENTCLDIDAAIMTRQRERKFVSAGSWLESFSPSPEGSALALIARGQALTKSNWQGHAAQHGSGNSVRYRLIDWLADSERFVVVTDGGDAGFERLELHYEDKSKAPVLITNEDLGRFVELSASDKLVACTNHRNELILIDIENRSAKILDQSRCGAIREVAWSFDGQWLAYTWPSTTSGGSRIRIANVKTGVIHDATEEVLSDRAPAWDPDGNYLYFASKRTFKPVRDAVRNDLGFVVAERLYALPLRKDVPSPFLHDSNPLVVTPRGEKVDEMEETTAVEIDFDAIASRIIPFPEEAAELADYAQLVPVKGRLLFVQYDTLNAALDQSGDGAWIGPQYAPSHSSLWLYDFEQQRAVLVASDVAQVKLAKNGQFVFFLWGDGDGTVRIFDPLQEISEDTEVIDSPADEYGRRSGLINLDEIEVSVNPPQEWAQMYHEAWRMQAQHFWDHDMSGIDWQLVRERYARLLPRIRTRAELSDLIWEMQGELGTSHAYEADGDYPETPDYTQGFLGADLTFDKKAGGYRVDNIMRGEIGDPSADSPLATAGIKVGIGDWIMAVDGLPVSAEDSVAKLLVNKGGKKIGLTVKDAEGETRTVTVEALASEAALRYRHWVNTNRALVHKATKGKVGYVHVPDMMEEGFAEFHRGYQLEHLKDGLIVDFRYNRGGNVSPLILQVLNRKVIGYDVPRWTIPSSYPYEAPSGPVVGLTNQFAASDGDIVSHSFKLMGIGPLVGKRTWGGIIGINPTHALVDGTCVTTPEFAGWFNDVGWNVENHGAEPDYDIDISPEESRAGVDSQLNKAIELTLESLTKKPVRRPDFSERPLKPIPHHPVAAVKTSGARRAGKRANQGNKKAS